ncbi:MAG: alanine racemase [Clostridia bacterium]|jgi:alanine racemase|nr:alanine racemase [Clostridia bacterium]
MHSNPPSRPVWVEINLKNIRHNFNEVRRLVGPQVQVMAVVKANAYGHGAAEVAHVLDAAGAERFGVALLQEAVQLREADIRKPILILGWTPPELYRQALEQDIALTVYSLQEARELSSVAGQGRKITVHLKVDTGMSRIGLLPGERGLEEALRILELPGLNVEGVFTHLAKADEKDKTFTQKQLALFHSFIVRVEEKSGFRFKLKHAANSAAIIDCPEAYFDMVRPGIMLYGLKPSDEVDLSKVELRQAVGWKARIAHVKKVPKDTPVSYGGIYQAPEESVIITLPLGYADGYSRLLSNKGQALVFGRRIPLVGRICMDQMMFNATAVPQELKVGAIVTLLGTDGADFISVDEIAQVLGTINYEIVCMISGRIPRFYQE